MTNAARRKAALLLMALDPRTAAELLKAARPEVVTELVSELAYLDQAGAKKKEPGAPGPASEFFALLTQKRGETTGQRFLKEMLDNALGKDRSKEMLGKLKEFAAQRDPFLPVRGVQAADLAASLAGESPQVAAVVLSELPPKRSAELLAMLDEKARLEAVRGMAAGQEAAPEVRQRVANLVMSRLKTPAFARQSRRDDQLRKVAIVLRGLGGELRTALIKAVQQTDAETAANIQLMMVTWNDIVSIADRSLQEVLRGMESKKLAMALIGADKAIVAKLRTNMSERAAAMLDEETSLLSHPKSEDIQKARESLLSDMRDLNAKNMLTFVEE